VEEALIMALDNHPGFRVDRIAPMIQRTFEEEERAVFDPVIDAGLAASREETPLGTPPTGDVSADEVQVDVGATKRFPTGTDARVGLTAERLGSDRFDTRYATRAGLSLTQALLRGRGREVNLVSLRQAGINTDISQYELRGAAEALVARTQTAYWDYALALRQLQIYEESVNLAQRQLEETQEIVRVGRLPETELVAARAEVALRRQELIDARNALELARLRLLRLVNPPGPGLWSREIVLLDEPEAPEIEMEEVDDHVQVALRLRPDLNQARLAARLEELEVVRTRNGLLPRLDLFISLGMTGYADSFSGSMEELTGDHYDLLAGLSFVRPVGNRGPRARHKRATLNVLRAREALENLSQLVALDVQAAYIELDTARRQIRASTATRRLEEEKVRIERERFRVGRSTSFLVAQAQRDLVRSRILEIRAVVTVLEALVNLYRLEGSLLERWGIRSHGAGPDHPGFEPEEGGAQ
jgi:outer membrane protein TolC